MLQTVISTFSDIYTSYVVFSSLEDMFSLKLLFFSFRYAMRSLLWILPDIVPVCRTNCLLLQRPSFNTYKNWFFNCVNNSQKTVFKAVEPFLLACQLCFYFEFLCCVRKKRLKSFFKVTIN